VHLLSCHSPEDGRAAPQQYACSPLATLQWTSVSTPPRFLPAHNTIAHTVAAGHLLHHHHQTHRAPQGATPTYRGQLRPPLCLLTFSCNLRARQGADNISLTTTKPMCQSGGRALRERRCRHQGSLLVSSAVSLGGVPTCPCHDPSHVPAQTPHAPPPPR
jgi:hypothetical protein